MKRRIGTIDTGDLFEHDGRVFVMTDAEGYADYRTAACLSDGTCMSWQPHELVDELTAAGLHATLSTLATRGPR